MIFRRWIVPVSLALAAAVAAVVMQHPVGPSSLPPSPGAEPPVAATDAAKIVEPVDTADAADAADTADSRPLVAAPPSVDTPAPEATEAAGFRVYLDPETGRFVPEPPAGAEVESDVATEALSTRSVDLVEQPSPVPGGGMMLDLRGRFQNVIEMSVDASGALSSDCAIEDASGSAGDEGVKP